LPSATSTTPRTGAPSTKVPFVLPRSSSRTVSPPCATSIRACRRETPGASTQTAHAGSRPTMLSPSARTMARSFHINQQRAPPAAPTGASPAATALPQKA